MMTAESMLSKRPVLGVAVILFFLLESYFRPIFIAFQRHFSLNAAYS